MTLTEQSILIQHIKSQVPPIGWTVTAWNIPGQPMQIKVAKHDLIPLPVSLGNPPIRHCWYIGNIDEWNAQYKYIKEHFEEKEYPKPIEPETFNTFVASNNNEPEEVRTSPAFIKLTTCPLCLQEYHLERMAEISLIATRRNVNYKDVVYISTLIHCPCHGILKRVGCFTDYEHMGFKGGIVETSVITKNIE